MSYSIVVFSGTVNALATNSDIPAVTDSHVTIVNNHYILPVSAELLFALARGASITRARITSPSLRAVTIPYVFPVERSATISDVPAVALYAGKGISFQPTEEISVDTSNDLGMGTERHDVVLGLRTQPLRRISGRIYTVRATTSVTLTANAWTSANMTLTESIAPGRYALVGAAAFSANLVAARFVFPDQYHRPGVLGTTGRANVVNGFFRYGEYGVFGEFNSYALPVVEFFASAADTNPELYLDLVKVS